MTHNVFMWEHWLFIGQAELNHRYEMIIDEQVKSTKTLQIGITKSWPAAGTNDSQWPSLPRNLKTWFLKTNKGELSVLKPTWHCSWLGLKHTHKNRKKTLSIRQFWVVPADEKSPAQLSHQHPGFLLGAILVIKGCQGEVFSLHLPYRCVGRCEQVFNYILYLSRDPARLSDLELCLNLGCSYQSRPREVSGKSKSIRISALVWNSSSKGPAFISLQFQSSSTCWVFSLGCT